MQHRDGRLKIALHASTVPPSLDVTAVSRLLHILPEILYVRSSYSLVVLRL